jgi:uncharacterized membrane protein YeaQ/YmgE (transglycosylase-associated protein family)
MTRGPAGDAAPAVEQQGEFLHVWGDTVRGNKLLIGVLVGIVCGLVGLYGGRAVVTAVGVEEHLVDVWSLITGILGCLAAGVITARISAPARIISEDAEDSGALAAAIDELGEGARGLGTLEDATDLSRAELEAAGLTEAFREAEARAASRAESRRDGGDA